MFANAEYAIGFAVGLVAVLVVVGLIYKFAGKQPTEYDERQQLIRGKGYKYAYFTLLIASAAVLVTVEMGMNLPVSHMLLLFSAISVSLIVYVAYCIHKDAYLAVNAKPRSFLLLDAFIVVVNILSFVGGIKSGSLFVDGVLSDTYGMNILMAGLFAVIFVLLAAKTGSERKEVENDEES